MASKESDKKLIINGLRIDGRSSEDLRSLRVEAGVLSEAHGSAIIEWGRNKIVCGVYGPRECIPRFEASPYKALIKCKYSMSPFSSSEEHGKSGPSRRSNELSKVIREVFENVIIAEAFPRTQIDIFIDVLQADGGTRTASIVAASVALANAGIPMREMVAAVAVGKADNTLVVDLGKEEDNFGQSDVPIAISSRNKNILLLQMDGLLTKDELSKMVDMAMRSSEKINSLQESALKKIYQEGQERKLIL